MVRDKIYMTIGKALNTMIIHEKTMIVINKAVVGHETGQQQKCAEHTIIIGKRFNYN